MTAYLKSLVGRWRSRRQNTGSADIQGWRKEIIDRTSAYTMTSPERVLATVNAVEYLVRNDIPGEIVECGVWRGAQMMAAALTLLELGAQRRLYLFDTFQGMPLPGESDVDHAGDSADGTFRAHSGKLAGERWCEAGIDEVRRNMDSTGYPADLVHLVKGMVETTIPNSAPERISLLRLDTDWYESTRHELLHLFPRVTRLGVVVIDDYGHWQGAKKALDEYLEANRIPCLLHRIDYTAREFVKA